MKGTPLREFLVVRKIANPNQRLIVAADSFEQKFNYAVVVAVSKGIRTIDGTRSPMPMVAGDTIMYHGTGMQIDYDNERLVLLREEDCVMILDVESEEVQ